MCEVYADHAATTPLAPDVFEAMRPYLEPQGFGNPSSVHHRGEAARDAIEQARARVAEFAGAMPEEIVFTASGSEANNLALKGVMGLAVPSRRRVVVSAIEHPSVLETAEHLARHGCELTRVAPRANGIVEPADLAAVLGDDVALVSVQWVNNEVGTIQPVAELAELTHAHGARFHVDAVQAAGKIPLGAVADLMSLAGHKFHGPQGAAVLVVKRRTRLMPLIHGGHQERSRRAGTENLPAIVGLGAAAERARTRLATEPRRLAALGARLLDGLLATVPRARMNGDRARRVGSVINLCFAGVDGEALLHELDRMGIVVSTGSACSAATPGPSHVLVAMGLTAEDAHASVRFSLGESNDDADIDAILRAVPGIVEGLRALGGGTGTERSERRAAVAVNA